MIYTLPITGFPFRPVEALRCDPTSQFVDLRHTPYIDPKNPLRDDPNAISAWFNDQCIGFLPRPKDPRDTERDEICKAIDDGKEIRAVAVNCAFIPEDQHGKPSSWSDERFDEYILYRCSLRISIEGQHNTTEERYYVHDGKKYRSITSVLKEVIPQEGEQWSEHDLNIAARYGNIIHKICEHDFMCAAWAGDCHSLVAKAVTDALDTENWVPNTTEKQVWDTDLMIAGTYDALAYNTDNKEYAVFDWKSSKQASPKHKAQVAFYAHNAGAIKAFVICFGSDNNKLYSVCEVNVEEEYKNLTKLIHDTTSKR